jgi:predicted neutral ceramidase superfamily lipid hydrolase
MDKKLFSLNRLYFLAFVSIAIWSLLIWDYLHKGVPSHHLLAREDLPAFSNWWGALLIPLLSWFILYRIQKREGAENGNNLAISGRIFFSFITALIFGVVLSIFFTLGNEDVPFYMMIALLASALFLRSYRAECFLGFVIGMTYTFGAVLPLLIGSILVLLCAILYLLVRSAILLFSRKLLSLTNFQSK